MVHTQKACNFIVSGADMRYPKRMYTKAQIINIYNNTKPFGPLFPQIPLDEKLSNISKIQSRHLPLIVRTLFCEFCAECNESGNKFNCNFVCCFGCRQAACAVCIHTIFTTNFPTVLMVKRMDLTTRKRTYLCLTCRMLGKQNILNV